MSEIIIVSGVTPKPIKLNTLNSGGGGSGTPASVYITVSEITGGHRLTIIDSSGSTKEVDILNGTNGKDGITPIKGIDYTDGENGVSVTHSWIGTTLMITSASGTSSADLKGDKGDPARWEDFSPEQQQAVIDGVVASVTGAAVPNTRTINGKSLSSDVVLTYLDIGALSADTPIPTKTSDLTNDIGFLTEHQDLSGYQRKLTAGNNITIDENGVISSTGGGTVDLTSDAIIDALGYVPVRSSALENYQTKLTAGSGIKIVGNVISLNLSNAESVGF